MVESSDREVEFKVNERGEIECAVIYGIKVCLGEYVRIYPRSIRLAVIHGIVKGFSSNAIILESEENVISIRLSEIKMLQKPKTSYSNR